MLRVLEYRTEPFRPIGLTRHGTQGGVCQEHYANGRISEKLTFAIAFPTTAASVSSPRSTWDAMVSGVHLIDFDKPFKDQRSERMEY